ncbi:hypothetical protein CQA66_09035 [Helicobacter aurati]|uniref:Uncharacterized protein n=1 Tax=Helicobacter aurati TaxID=137778 RepID=A0A3D8IV91_9HELI|nr:hypothetical protein [Helicobacter aurati]RDU69168.1 hypothetical protein CQA66_09035 [Helicobacter aurati]
MDIKASIGTANNNLATSINHYTNTSNQSGIAANSLDMQIAQDIHLRGAYIQGNSGALTTNTLTHSNLRNFAAYQGINTNKAIPAFGFDRGITSSSVSSGLSLQTSNDSKVLRAQQTNDQVIDQSTVAPKISDKLNQSIQYLTQGITYLTN